MDTSILCGLITHVNSIYDVQDYKSEFKSLKNQQLNKFDSFISKENDHNINEIEVIGIFYSLVHFMRISYKWSRYLGMNGKSRYRQIYNLARELISLTCRMTQAENRYTERLKALRVLNINSSHLKVLEKQKALNCDVVLILEDDAKFPGKREFTEILDQLREISTNELTSKYYIDLSESFTLSELNAENQIDKTFSYSFEVDDKEVRMQKMKIPITNTLCAVYYEKQMAEIFRLFLDSRTKTRFYKYTPVDWVFNEMILEINKQGETVDCFKTSPGLFLQRSIHE